MQLGEASRLSILADEFVEDTAEYTDAEYKQKIATVSNGPVASPPATLIQGELKLDFVLKLQHEYIVKLGIRCIIDRLQKRKGQGIRKSLLRDTRRRRDANKERRTRILERMEDQQNERFLNASLVGAENTPVLLDRDRNYSQDL